MKLQNVQEIEQVSPFSYKNTAKKHLISRSSTQQALDEPQYQIQAPQGTAINTCCQCVERRWFGGSVIFDHLNLLCFNLQMRLREFISIDR